MENHRPDEMELRVLTITAVIHDRYGHCISRGYRWLCGTCSNSVAFHNLSLCERHEVAIV